MQRMNEELPEADLAQDATPDRLYARVAEALHDTAVEIFPASAPADEAYEVRRERMTLLQSRRAMRLQLEHDNADLVGVQLALALVGRRAKRMRRAQWQRHKAQLETELWEAWRQRDFASMHRLRVSLAQNRRGPKRRLYNAVRCCPPSEADWIAFLSKDGPAGGMECAPVDYAEYEAGYIAERAAEGEVRLGYDAKLRDLVDEDMRGVCKHLGGARKRRARPRWAMPVEALHLAVVAPRVDAPQQPVRIAAPVFHRCFSRVLERASAPPDGRCSPGTATRASPC